MHSKCIPLSPVVLRFNGDTKRSSACKERKRRKRCPRFSAFAFSSASEDEKETGQRNFGETVVVVTGCLDSSGPISSLICSKEEQIMTTRMNS
jgi:hypothetical protein